MVPDELTLDLHRLDVAIVEFANYARIPMILKFCEFLRDIY
jgi:hypothetical protein